MLKIDKLKKQYKNFTLNCSMEVKEGMITGFVGPNGSGKSTTLKAVLGLIYIVQTKKNCRGGQFSEKTQRAWPT